MPCSDRSDRSEAPLRFRLDDPEHRWSAVRVLTDTPLARTALEHSDGAWSLQVPKPPVARVEYRFEVTGGSDGGTHAVCDPANPLRVPTAFGDRSVVQLPGYAPPWWLDAEPVAGRRTHLRLPAETAEDVPVTVWAPREARRAQRLPLLMVHDGPEYDRLAAITRYSAALVRAGRVPPHRVALLHPVARDDWYSLSPRYVRSLTGPVLGGLRERWATGSVVAMGASLGGLVSLVTAVQAPGVFAGVFSQSGSFFSPVLDQQESDYPYFWRITHAVDHLARAPLAPVPLRVGLTCGALEENAANNRRMASALRRAGHRVTHAEVPDLHNYTAWRDALDPHLTAVLQDCFS